MRHNLFDQASRRRRGARLKAYASIERRVSGPFSGRFATMFRRARAGDDAARLTRYLAIARHG